MVGRVIEQPSCLLDPSSLGHTTGNIVPNDDTSSSIAKELSKLEKICKSAIADLSSSHSVRETLELADVGVPQHLREIAKTQLPILARLSRLRDIRVEEVVMEQLDYLSRERSEFLASREFDRLKASDWPMLLQNYPELFRKSVKEASLIFERKRKRKLKRK